MDNLVNYHTTGPPGYMDKIFREVMDTQLREFQVVAREVMAA
ncbi:MAG: hypothetical protein PHO37_09890 [Kiritimatiellae bacterium]|nr:hypothetical protein [Kiritimatiellia bacterium]